MSKTLSKVLAVILCLSVLFSLPVMASAEESTFTITSGEIIRVYNGIWDEDYVGTIEIKLTGEIDDIVSDVLLTIGTGNSVSNVKKIKSNDAGCAGETNKSITISLPYNAKMNHGETYNFYFPAGTFISADGALNEEFTISVTGNAVIEMLEVESVPVTPIQKLIVYLSGLEVSGFWEKLVNFCIKFLTWFVTI